MEYSQTEAAFRKAGLKDFPCLAPGNFNVTSPQDHRYNCIAWAGKDTNKWWWPLGHYWPGGIPKSTTLDAFTMMYATLGYEECATAALESGYEKIALYMDQHGVVTHAARQLTDGTWTSKMGRDHDIQHTLEALEGGLYGKAAKYLRRRLGPS